MGTRLPLALANEWRENALAGARSERDRRSLGRDSQRDAFPKDRKFTSLTNCCFLEADPEEEAALGKACVMFTKTSDPFPKLHVLFDPHEILASTQSPIHSTNGEKQEHFQQNLQRVVPVPRCD